MECAAVCLSIADKKTVRRSSRRGRFRLIRIRDKECRRRRIMNIICHHKYAGADALWDMWAAIFGVDNSPERPKRGDSVTPDWVSIIYMLLVLGESMSAK